MKVHNDSFWHRFYLMVESSDLGKHERTHLRDFIDKIRIGIQENSECRGGPGELCAYAFCAIPLNTSFINPHITLYYLKPHLTMQLVAGQCMR